MHNRDNEIFENAMRTLEVQIANVGTHLTIDAQARQLYAQQIGMMSAELRTQVQAGKLSWPAAATQAQDARNLIMEMIRIRSTPVGLALAQRLKSEGKTLNEIIARKTQHLFGNAITFEKLTTAQQNTIYKEVAEAAGRSNPKVSATMRNLSYAGRGLIVISVALTAYNVATSDNKLDAAGREATITGVGVGGGIAGGALAGLACGPGAPACVTLGAFVGGALAAFGMNIVWQGIF